MAISPHQLDSDDKNSWISSVEAQKNQTSSGNAAQKETVVLFNHFYEKLAFFLIRLVSSVVGQAIERLPSRCTKAALVKAYDE